jgi:acyl transferase domain-containing protein
MSNYENDHGETMEGLDGAAVIGMAGRFPRADNIGEFWQNLVNGVDCITFYQDRELADAGVNPETLKHPDYVKAKGEVSNVDMFDAAFFGINPREAELTDPQHRMLLECAWEAMEHAGYDSGKYDGPIGVYAGKSMDYYLLLNVYPYIKKEISAGSLQAAIGNDKDSLTTLISYRLNLTGPAITVQTSSSTSLVAVCVACQSLLTYQCDIALAGGITAGPPIKSGYLYQEGGIWAQDGHCRAFDADAKGFVPGSGMGMVVLKRLEDAVKDGDTIWAVIKGFAVNNDGSNKVSYSAPSVDAQAQVVAQAQAMAGVHPETIQYIEAHGTGTNLGDPIEMTALTQAFRAQTGKKQFCAIGSLKSNIGHLDNAAGVASLIKVALSLKNGKIPASLHFKNPNPKIDFDNSPFFVNTALKEWTAGQTPRRAGVTSLGMGGTNAHVIVEEAPEQAPTGASRPRQLLMLSAQTDTALDKMTQNLGDHLKTNSRVNLADVAYTLHVGRRDFNRRRAVLCQTGEDAVEALDKLTPGLVFDGRCQFVNRPVVFMFSGQGAQYVNMGKELYQWEPVFRENIDKCAEFLAPLLNLDLRDLIYPGKEEDIEKNGELLMQTRITQPVLFMIEYSLARMWREWGVTPAAMTGHSIGEFAAACIAGCMSLEDALTLVAERGRSMQDMEGGAMLSVGIAESDLEAMIEGSEGLSVAAVNSPKHTVVSGTSEAIDALEKEINRRNLFCRRLRTSHAFHSPMMEPIMDSFAEAVSKVTLNPPAIPFISGVTGTWITGGEACDPSYWAAQLRQPVRFSDGITELLTDPNRLLLEVGPGNSLCVLVKQHIDSEGDAAGMIFSSIRHIKQGDADTAFLLKTLAGLWLSGVTVDWNGYYKNETRRRIPLPAYPFERKRYWLEGLSETAAQMELAEEAETQSTAPVEEAEAGEECEKDGAAAAKTFQPRPALPEEYAAPTNELETAIAEIWEDILGIKPIGINDSFFDLGGHSLLATLFLSRLQETYDVRLELRVIFESPTVATIAQLVQEERAKAGDAENIESLLDEVEGLSQEEVQAALADEKEED